MREADGNTESERKNWLRERYALIGDLKKFWRGTDDQMHQSVDIDGLAKFVYAREIGLKGFDVLDLSRSDVAMAFADDDGVEPDWPYLLTDDHMTKLALQIQTALTQEEDTFWDLIREFSADVAPPTEGEHAAAVEAS